MAFKLRPEDEAPKLKLRPEDETPKFRLRPEDLAPKTLPMGEGKATGISQGATPLASSIKNMVSPYVGAVGAQFEALPGTQFITRKMAAPVKRVADLTKKAAGGKYGPTAEVVGETLEMPGKVAGFAAEAFGEGGITPADIWTLGASKLIRTGTAAAAEAAKISERAAFKLAAERAMAEKRITQNALKAAAEKRHPMQLVVDAVKAANPQFDETPGLAEDLVQKTASLSNPLPYYRQAVEGADAVMKTFKENIETISKTKLDQIIMYSKDPQKKISDFIFDRIEDGSMAPIDAARILGVELKKSESVPMLIERLKGARTAFGQGLNRYSQAARALEPYLEKDAKMRAALNRAMENTGPDTIIGRVFKPINELSGKAIGVWRGLLTSQLSTAMANIISQTGRYSIGTVTDAMSGLGRAAMGMEPLDRSMANAMEDMLSIGRSFKPDGLQKTLSVLDKYPIHKQMIESKFFNEAGMSQGLMKFATFINNTQEKFFRSVAFDARLRGNLSRLGYKIEDLQTLMQNPKNAKAIEGLVNDATRHALELTFAAQPTSKAANAVLRFYQQVPLLYTLTTPFPRFMMNSAKFVTEHSPLGMAFMRVGKGSAKYNVETAAKALTGTMMLAGGLALRGSKYAGPNWYEVKTDPDRNPNKVISLQNQGPLMAETFVADLVDRALQVKNGERRDLGYSLNDINKAMYSIQRSDLAGLPILDNFVFNKSDLLSSKDNFIKLLQDQVNNFIGGFSTPIKSVRDIANWEEPMERKAARQVNFYGQFADAFPGWRESLPTQYSPTRKGPALEYDTKMKQLAGVRTIERTDFERVLEELQIKPFEWNKPTGSRYVDNVINKRLGDFMPSVMMKIINSPAVQNKKTIDDKRGVVLGFLRTFANQQKNIVLDSNPTLKEQLKKSLPAQRKFEAALAGVDPVTWEPFYGK